MAKKIQLATALQKGRFTKIEATTKEGTREMKVFFLIVCEGSKTEPNYFKSFPQMAGNMVFDLTFEGGGISTIKVLEKAVEIKTKYPHKFDRIWIVFDKDSFPESHFNKAILDAEKEGVKAAWSNEAFELWYLLHFVFRNTGMKREEYQKALESQINTLIRIKTGQKGCFKYKKNDAAFYKILQEYGNENNAINWAEKLNKVYTGQQYAKYNPCTMVNNLVQELRGLSEDLKREIEDKYKMGI